MNAAFGRSSTAMVILTVFPLPALAEPFTVPVDTANSSVTVELCVTDILGQECDSDTSGIAGETTIELNNPTAPTEITLYDFNFSLTESIDLFIQFDIGPITLGTLDVAADGLGFSDLMPGVPIGPVPILADGFSFFDVQAISAGSITYESDGVVCDLLSGSGLPCSDVIVLDGEVQMIDFDGSIEVVDGVATLSSSVLLTIPLDEENPDVGMLTIDGTLVGSAEIPQGCDGDANGDSAVDPLDSGFVLARFGCVVGAGDPDCDASDVNDDGAVDPLDVGYVLARFGPCE